MAWTVGTSGLRGLSRDLEGRPAALYATAFARYLLESGLAKAGDTVLVGRDFRPSSPAIAAIVIGALSKAGYRLSADPEAVLRAYYSIPEDRLKSSVAYEKAL